MKRIIIYCNLVVFLLLIGCSERIFYKTIVKDGMHDEPLPLYSYYTIIELNVQKNKNEYLLPIDFLNTVLFDSTKKQLNKKELWKELNKYDGILYLDSSDIFIFPDTLFKIRPSIFIDSLSSLSTNFILDKYFVNSCRLKIEELSVEQYRCVVYTLVKRKEYVFTYIYKDNNDKLKQTIYYGKLISHKDKVTENNIKKKSLAK